MKALNRAAAAEIDWGAVAEKREQRAEQIGDLLPRVLIAGWKLHEGGHPESDGAVYFNRTLRLSLIVSVAREDDGKRWVHLSIACADRLPTYQDLVNAKDMFLGDRKAIMVFPKRSEHINIHRNCLHLFACLDQDPLPDFTSGTKSL